MSIYKPRDKAEAKRSLIVLIAVFVIAIIVAGVLIGMATSGRKEIRLTVDGFGSYSVTLTYVDGGGMHQSQNTWSGHYEVKLTASTTANLIAVSDGETLIARAYINDVLVDEQSGTWVMVSATP